MLLVITFIFGMLSGLAVGFTLWYSPKGYIIKFPTDDNAPEPPTPQPE